ncbi:alkaline phosphatase family protein [Chitinimonas taiwanensis]|uniref:alkaline phosphatase family protein n=1 Tax=Chitinimonas taiwanensis TaxID=240412 RepID=UPI0035B0D01E
MSMQQIEHVVVLMLENRSFDSMLGWLYEHDQPAVNIPPAAPGDAFRGLQQVDLQAFLNRASNGLSSPPVRGAAGFTVPSADPGEEFAHVNQQFFNTPNPPPGATATMTGVLQDFVDVMTAQGFSAQDIEAAGMIMQTYTPGQLPVLSQLARHYAVCDDWFASVPSQTNPNRAFLMTGTSHGLVNNGQLETSPEAKEIEKILHMGIGDDRFPEPTLFNALAAGGVDWAVFWQTSFLPHKIAALLEALPTLIDLLKLLDPAVGNALMKMLQALQRYTDYLHGLTSGELPSNYTWRLFPQIQQIPDASAHFKDMQQFHAQARAGSLPRFSYLEPTWTISQSATDAGLKNLLTQLGNDYHPPGNLVVAENFVRDVYASLIANQTAWNKTLFIITFDEFVGSFDHVPPPAAVAPWGDQPPGFDTHGFDFKRYGARVPTLLISPWVAKGTVFRAPGPVPFDHTAIIANTLKWQGLDEQIGNFGERTRQAPSFEQVLSLQQPRRDAADIGFLQVGRRLGEPVRFGDQIVLRNQYGKYLGQFQRAMKRGWLPDDLLGFAVDLNLAAYFPTLSEQAATLTLRTTLADPPAQVDDGSSSLLLTLEEGVGAANFLGAWRDSPDCYYYNNYVQGPYTQNQTWIIQQVDKPHLPLHYGDRIYLESAYASGQRLSANWDGDWLTTKRGGDYWIIEPAVPV